MQLLYLDVTLVKLCFYFFVINLIIYFSKNKTDNAYWCNMWQVNMAEDCVCLFITNLFRLISTAY